MVLSSTTHYYPQGLDIKNKQAYLNHKNSAFLYVPVAFGAGLVS